jgi:hypothetical protein
MKFMDGKMDKLLSGLQMEHLQSLFQFYKNYTSEYLKINSPYIRKNINLESLDNEIFEPHPYIPIKASNYGRIKYLDTILEQKQFSDGYIYVNVPYEIEKLLYETKENKIPKNKMSTPIVEGAVNYAIEKYSGKYSYHPCIQIGITEDSRIINWYEYEYKYGSKYKNKNFRKIFKDKIINGIKFIEIPIYVYRLVAETWLENPNYEIYKTVHHITNNGYDNTIYNLMWVSDKQHKIIENR